MKPCAWNGAAPIDDIIEAHEILEPGQAPVGLPGATQPSPRITRGIHRGDDRQVQYLLPHVPAGNLPAAEIRHARRHLRADGTRVGRYRRTYDADRAWRAIPGSQDIQPYRVLPRALHIDAALDQRHFAG